MALYREDQGRDMLISHKPLNKSYTRIYLVTGRGKEGTPPLISRPPFLNDYGYLAPTVAYLRFIRR